MTIAFRPAHLAALSFLAMSATALADGQGLPPLAYDHPYRGRITISTVESQEELRSACHSASTAIGACVLLPLPVYPSDTCRIIIMKKYAADKLLLRHEHGHCNGWLGHHPDIRPYPNSGPMWPTANR